MPDSKAFPARLPALLTTRVGLLRPLILFEVQALQGERDIREQRGQRESGLNKDNETVPYCCEKASRRWQRTKQYAAIENQAEDTGGKQLQWTLVWME